MNREYSIQIRNNETMIISILIKHAIKQGSKNHNKLYMVYTKLVYKILGIKSGKRDNLSQNELAILSTMEIIIAQTILEMIEKDTNYKDIYKEVKNKLHTMKSLFYNGTMNINNIDIRLVA